MAKLVVESQETKPIVEKVLSDSSSSPVNGGNGAYSYTNNSTYQKLCASVEMKKIEEEIAEKLDVSKLASVSNTIRIADLGCATGPNTFNTIQHIIQTIACSFDSPALQFQVFFNDKVSNDFNTLFLSLPPERSYFAAGVPGSFHHRLFPTSSLHFVHASYALNWLSRLPEALRDETSPAWNKGRIHYLGAPVAVADAYAEQFARDMEGFLRARAEEIAAGGMMVIITAGTPDGMSSSHLPSGVLYDLLASTLMDMSKEGIVSEGEVDSFNLPLYITCPSEMTQLIEKNGEFIIERMEVTDPTQPWLKAPIDNREWINHIRAAMEAIFMHHFQDLKIIDQMFQRVIAKLEHHSHQINSNLHEKVQLFLVLKRK